MKYIVILCFLTCVFFSCKKQETCNEYDATCELIDLSDTLDPVCGCDGITYQNEGYAKCVGKVKRFTKGACK
jgi:hypothetical protein